MQKRHRVFIAINLPEDIKRELGFYADKWSRSQGDRGSSTGSGPELPAKWTSKDNLHITLEFLGDLTDQELADVCKVAGEVAKRHKPFSITLNKVLYGPPKKIPPRPPKFSEEVIVNKEEAHSNRKLGRARMVWAMGEKSKELSELKNDLEELLLEKVSFRPEGRGFTPHITLARISEWEFRKIEPEERPEINENIDLVFSVESIEIMESVLKRKGPEYQILESCELGAP